MRLAKFPLQLLIILATLLCDRIVVKQDVYRKTSALECSHIAIQTSECLS